MVVKPLTLTKEVSDKYSLKDIKPGTYLFPVYGEINLHLMSLEKADQLYASGFPYLVEKKKRSVDTSQ